MTVSETQTSPSAEPVEAADQVGVDKKNAESAITAPTRTRSRRRNVARQFLQFGLVGASGFIVNQAIFVLSKKAAESGWGVDVQDAFLNLLGSQYHFRWYHVFSVIAFLLANIWNFCLNRYWTFRHEQKRAWWKQLPQFMAVGVFGLIITLVVSTALVHPESPIALPHDIFDNSTGLRTRAYWGNFIGVIVAVPANFLFNKLWTFRSAPRTSRKAVRVVPPRTGSAGSSAGSSAGFSAGAGDADV